MDERALLDLFGAMDRIRGAVEECRYYPCHFKGQDCSLCFCPFYPCFIYDLGGEIVLSSNGRYVWSCKNCFWVHDEKVVEEIVGYFSTVPRQMIVEAEWEFLNESLQNILFGEVLSGEIFIDDVKFYSMMEPNFYGKECVEVDATSFMIVTMEGWSVKSIKRVSGFEGLSELQPDFRYILLPEKSDEMLTGFVDGRFVRCDLK